MSENLLIEQRDVNHTLALSQHLFGEATTISSIEREREDLIPLRLLAFIHSSTLNHVCFRVIDDLNLHEGLNFRSSVHILSQVHEGVSVLVIEVLLSAHASLTSAHTTSSFSHKLLNKVVSEGNVLSSDNVKIDLDFTLVTESDSFSLFHQRLQLAFSRENTGQKVL